MGELVSLVMKMVLWCQMVNPLPGGENMSQSSPWWSRPDTFPRKNATIPRYGFSSPGKTVTPIAFSGNTLQVDISNLWIVIFQALMSVGVIAQQSF